ncbi:MAG: thiaminase II [Synergistaceae bacterium]|jgi:thiaminase/transcriptional activator TenA|nr:thiaminase II [Synergistaceae bacterium]
MSFSRGLKELASSVWEDGYRHPFVQELGRGTLERTKFKFYLLQDYKYLLSYAKVFALGVLKSETEEMMSRFSASQNALLNGEMNIHREYMSSFDVTQSEMEAVRPSLFNRTYTANMLAVGQSGGTAEIIATLFPCAWTYSDYARRLVADYPAELQNNFYRSWIQGYASEQFAASFEWFYEALDKTCERKSDAELRQIEGIFKSSVEFEYLFWDMSYKCQMSYN